MLFQKKGLNVKKSNMMKGVYMTVLLTLPALILVNCTLEKEPEPPPAGTTNRVDPVFSSTTLKAISHDSIRAEARLSDLGNLNILKYGWVWSQNPEPMLNDNNLTLDSLGINYSFVSVIPGLIVGNTYHLRPFVATGADTIYGPETTYLMGIPKVNDIILLDTAACLVRVKCSLQSPILYTAFGIVYDIGPGLPTLQQNDGQAPGTVISNDSFEIDLTMLNPNTLYSLRAYAISDSGIGYSRVLPVTTPFSLIESASFAISTDAKIFKGAIVTFTNTSVGATSFSWDFGDGVPSTEASPTHIFNNLGNMTVVMTAENGGCRLTKDTVLTVTSNPFEDYWVPVPGGIFMMGCDETVQDTCLPSELPVHEVTISAFEMGRTEINQEQWQAVTGWNPSAFNTCLYCPVELVSWDQIVNEFIPALYRKTGRNYRLPTEAEWEYAARGGANTKYAGSNDLDMVGWHFGNSALITQPVEGKEDNGYGLFDMSGNVWEWVEDYWHNDYTGAPTDGSPWVDPPGFARVMRGGSYRTDPLFCRISSRSSLSSITKRSDVGFRLAR
ncbi:MAG: PKD domain-containing protein [Haliscomenobacteraceae bacterium CHB4]|nr:PKD domain-containing protein [Haliscomenobacteraceae bacterium CHB4]